MSCLSHLITLPLALDTILNYAITDARNLTHIDRITITSDTTLPFPTLIPYNISISQPSMYTCTWDIINGVRDTTHIINGVLGTVYTMNCGKSWCVVVWYDMML